MLRVRKGLSFEAASTDAASWPKTLGIWVYAIVAAAVAITYGLNQNQTPAMIKALAVAFAGYVLALITAAYGSDGAAGQAPASPQSSTPPANAMAAIAIAPNGSEPANDKAPASEIQGPAATSDQDQAA